MGSIIQKLADEIELHGSYEAYCAWRGSQELENHIPAPNIQLLVDPTSTAGVSRILYVKPGEISRND